MSSQVARMATCLPAHMSMYRQRELDVGARVKQGQRAVGQPSGRHSADQANSAADGQPGSQADRAPVLGGADGPVRRLRQGMPTVLRGRLDLPPCRPVRGLRGLRSVRRGRVRRRHGAAGKRERRPRPDEGPGAWRARGQQGGGEGEEHGPSKEAKTGYQ